ncbi:MAG: tetratricopeptide repeat protein [Rhodospirillales bacterium]
MQTKECSAASRMFVALSALVLALTFAASPALAGYQEGKAAFEKGDYDTAWKELEPLAKKGDGKAAFLVASMYHTGRGVPVSYKDAAEWYRKSADAGDMQGVFMMGVVHEGGIGIPRDIAEAFKWYKKSADRGFYAAILKVANMYGKGPGVPKDNAQSYLWFSIAELRVPTDSNDRFELPIVKDKLSTLITKEQLAEAERRAKAWKPTAR